MTSKERVLNALNHKPVDRVPMDLFGMASSLVDEEYFKLLDYLGLDRSVDPIRKGTNCNYYDERILDMLDIDIRRVWVGSTNLFPKNRPDGSYVNEWGMVQKKGRFGIEFVRFPLEGASAEEIRNYNWPKAAEIYDIRGMRERAKRLSEENRYAVSLRAPMNGIFEIACWLRGTENFMVDIYEDPDAIHELCEQILKVQMDCYGMILDEVGEYVDIVETGDDYGSQMGLLISPDCLKEFILTRRKRLNDMIKQKAPHAKVFLHCCGSISKIIPDLIETGVDVLNPVQTAAAGMDPVDLKENFGSRIVFHGGVDTQKAMKGGKAEVRTEVANMLESMNRDGGYILASCNHIQSDIPVENVLELYAAAKELSLQA